MTEILAFVSSPQFLVTAVLVLITLLLLKNSIVKQVMLNSLSQIPNSPNEPSGKTTENGLAISDTTAVESLSADPVEQFSLIASDDSELVLKRIDISSVEIDKYIQIPTLGSIRDGVVAKSMLSSFAGSATQLGSIAAANPNGIFTSTVNPASLTKFANDTYSTMIHGSKGVVKHAGFQSASTSVFAPLIVFQALSMVTGQYYLQGITKQLESIDKKIERLVQFHHIERLAKIRHCVHLVQKLHRINHPNIEDMVSLRRMQSEIGVIHEEYVHYLSTLDLDDLKNLKKWFTSAKLEELLAKVNDTSFDFNLKMAVTTDELLHLMTIIEIMLNSRMSDNIENRARRLGELVEEVSEWDSKEFYRTRFENTSVADFYAAAIEKAQEIYDKGTWGKDKVSSAINHLKEKQAQIEESLGGKIHALEMGRTFITQMTEPVEILYLSDSSSGDRILVKRQATTYL
jgi:hypothetical protein